MSWETRLIRPVVPAKGKPIITLSDARAYVLKHVVAGVKVMMLAVDGQVPDLVAQSAVAHIVHGPPKSLGRGKPDRPWMKRKPRA